MQLTPVRGGIKPKSRSDMQLTPARGGIKPKSKSDMQLTPARGGIKPKSNSDMQLTPPKGLGVLNKKMAPKAEKLRDDFNAKFGKYQMAF
jgi:hypothetical protein